jgi:hypothetical protein
MKRSLSWFIWLLLLSVTGYGSGQATEYRFADLPWGTPRSEVEQQMVIRGYQPTEPNSYGDVTFWGEVFNRQTAVVMSFNDAKRLVKVEVYIYLQEPGGQVTSVELIETFNRLRDGLTDKYGNPSSSSTSYLYYYLNDQTFSPLQLSRVLKTNSLFARWDEERGKSFNLMTLVEADEANIYIFTQYLSKSWFIEAERRSAFDTRDF